MSAKQIYTFKWYLLLIMILAIGYNYQLLSSFQYTNVNAEHLVLSVEHQQNTSNINPAVETYEIIQRIQYELVDNFYVVKINSIPSNSHGLDKYLATLDNTTNCERSVFMLHAHQCCEVQHTINHLYSLGFNQIIYKHLPNVSSDYKKTRNEGNNIMGCLGLNIHENDSNMFKYLHKLSDKTQLYHTIMTYCNKYRITASCMLWMPLTYDLTIADQRVNFFRQLPCNNEPNHEWLIKTSMHSGRGVTLINNPNLLRKLYLTPAELQQSQCVVDIDENDTKRTFYQNMSRVLVKNAVGQKLISNALEYKSCSFHIRSVFILASYSHPKLVFYVRSYVMRSLDPSEFRSNVHYSIHFNDTEDASPPLQALADYFGDRFNITDIEEQIKHAAKNVFNSLFDGWDAPWKDWQHYAKPALDFLVTDEFQVKFLDFNSHHGNAQRILICFEKENTEHGTQVRFRKDIFGCLEAKQAMEEMVNIEIEIATKKRKSIDINTLESLNRFQTVIWDW